MRSVVEYVKAHRYGLAISAITFAVSAFIGVLGGKLICMEDTEPEVVHDTLYVRSSKADSLLQDIATKVKDINSKIPVKKNGRRRRIKKDTIKVDATIHLDNVNVTE